MCTFAPAIYLTSTQNPSSESKKLPKKRKKTSVKKTPDVEKAEGSASTESETKLQAESKSEPKPLTKGPVDELPEVGEAEIAALSSDEREEYAGKLKAAGNQAYGAKEYDRAITLYGKAILCKPDPIFYSNRAACYNAKGEFDLVIQDTTAALAMDNEYVKALNRRAKAYEHTEQYSEALLDFTASCIIDGFNNEASTQSVERLLKKVAEKKGREILATKVKKLPSPTFVSNYLQSFRVKERPTGLEDAAELSEESGLGQLRYGLKSMETKTGQGYEDAAIAFNKAIELGELGGHEAYAYNMRGTFRYLQGDNEEALADLTKSIELEPSLIQSYIKRASMHLELGHQADAAKDFEAAEKQDSKDPDIYYHRAQLHFILGEFPDASRDYQKSIDLDPDFIFSHIQLGVTQYKMGSIASSMATFRRTIKNFVTAGDVYNYYGELLLDQQKHEEAISKFDTAIEMEQKNKPSGSGMNVLPLINKALALFQWKQDYAEAEKLCEKALISKHQYIPRSESILTINSRSRV